MESGDRFNLALTQNAANYAPLTPLSFLVRVARVHPQRPAIVHGNLRRNWAETYRRCRRLASALQNRGIRRGDVVVVLAPNIPAMIEAHFGVPMAGAVLATLNYRLDAKTLGFMLRHARAKMVLVDGEFAEALRAALIDVGHPVLVVDLRDHLEPAGSTRIGSLAYEDLLAEGDDRAAPVWPENEWDAISLNYTSGTTAEPKGVVYHHRGAYLNAVNNSMVWSGMGRHPRYLWTLPMFHCNGWCFPWTIAAVAGVNICLRRVEAATIFQAVIDEGVTHMCGAPIVFNMLATALEAQGKTLEPPVEGMIAGAAPPPALLEAAERVGVTLTHTYGLTETYGPASICETQVEWNGLPLEERASRMSRQGVSGVLQEDMTVLDPATLQPVPADGKTIGELMFRGNIVMKGYLDNPAATAKAFEGGWFHTGDLAVMHPDGYAKILDRSKDIVISGGENISSLEVEETLHRHHAVFIAAVVACPDAKWGEVPWAFVELKNGAAATQDEIIDFCRRHIAGFKLPKRVIFGPVPRTATGKIQKFVLRDHAKATVQESDKP